MHIPRFLTKLFGSSVAMFMLSGFVAASSAQANRIKQIIPEGESPTVLAARSAAIRKHSRFLGWKFAARSQQETARWRRPLQPLVGDASSRSHSGEARFSPAAGVPYAGFDFRPILPTGYIPTAVVAGDFNEDGRTDFAVSNGGDNSVFVYLGNGDGTFKVPEILYTQGQGPDWITAVKLRDGGHLDLAVTNGDSSNLEIFPGNGDGTFGASTEIALKQIPTFVLTADVNQDGSQDLVVGLTIDPNQTQSQVEVLIGDGLGGFSRHFFTPALYGDPDFPVPTEWVAVGDLNNDGFPDIVTTVDSGIVYLSNAGKSFSLGTEISPQGGALVVELGDMDEDGCLDALQSTGYSYLVIGKGTCDGGFVEGPNLAELGDFDPALKITDIDGDGHLDVVGSAAFFSVGGPGYGNEGGYLVSVLKGDGKGNVAPAEVYRGGTDAFSLIVADFTGDGRPEIITSDSLENHATYFQNDGTGHFEGARGETVGYLYGAINAPYPFGEIETPDLNGDHKPDLLFMEVPAYVNQPAELTGVLNDGSGKFLPAVHTGVTVGDIYPPPVPIFAAGNFRGLAQVDVIYINTYNGFNNPHVVAFFPGNGDGSFGTPVVLTTLTNPLQVVAGDFNKDGKLDFAVVGTDVSGANWEFDIFLGRANGTFTQQPTQLFPNHYPGMQVLQFIVGDFNHDGKPDLLMGLDGNSGWVDSGDDLLEVLGNGNGTFQAPAVLISHFGAVAVGDLNGDGYLDLVQKRDPSEDVGAQLFFTPAVTVYLGQADGSYRQQPTYYLPGVGLPSFDPVYLADFNGDGILDIGYRDFPTQYFELIEPRLYVLQGNGDGTFSQIGHVYQLQALSAPYPGADFNGDGKNDLLEMVGFSSSFHTIEAAPSPPLDMAIDSNPILETEDSATVTLAVPAISTQTVTLSASDPTIQLPPTLTFNAGQQSQQFSFTLGPGYDSTHIVALYATLGGTTATAYGYNANPNVKVGVVASLMYDVYPLQNNFYALTPGENTSYLALRLDSEGGYSGTFSSFQCIGLPVGASCSFDQGATNLLPGGTSEVGFTVDTSSDTPYGTYPVQITTTDGFYPASVTLSLGVGDFSLSVNPQMISMGPNGFVQYTVGATATNGVNEFVTLSCAGLPPGTTCGQDAPLGTQGGQVNLEIDGTSQPAADYKFQIFGKANVAQHAIVAVLRVGDFSTSLDKTAATLSPGNAANFTLTLTSINHYATNIQVSCQSPSAKVTCAANPPVVALADGGQATVTLTVTTVSSRAALWTALFSFGVGGVLLCLLPVSFFSAYRRSRFLTTGLCALLLAAMLACGGGGSEGGGNPPPSPEIISIPVTSLADSTLSDDNNQKTSGPIVITLQ